MNVLAKIKFQTCALEQYVESLQELKGGKKKSKDHLLNTCIFIKP